MRYFTIFLLMIVVTGCWAEVSVPPTAILVDTTLAVIFSPGGTEVITQSDIAKLTLAGAPQSLEDKVFESLVLLDAKKFNISPSDDAVDRYLAMVQKENNLTREQLKEVATSAGLTYDEMREKFREMQIINSMMDYKVKSKMIIPQAQIDEYHCTHPIIQEAKATLQRGFIPRDEKRSDDQQKALKYMAKSGKPIKNTQWDKPFSVIESEMAEDKAHLFNLKPRQISVAQPTPMGYEVFRMIELSDRKETPLEERQQEIMNALQRPLFEQLLNDYKKSLSEGASVLYLNAPQA